MTTAFNLFPEKKKKKVSAKNLRGFVCVLGFLLSRRQQFSNDDTWRRKIRRPKLSPDRLEKKKTETEKRISVVCFPACPTKKVREAPPMVPQKSNGRISEKKRKKR